MANQTRLKGDIPNEAGLNDSIEVTCGGRDGLRLTFGHRIAGGR